MRSACAKRSDENVTFSACVVPLGPVCHTKSEEEKSEEKRMREAWPCVGSSMRGEELL